MLVSQILRSKGDTVFTVGPSETVAAVTALLHSRRVGALVVLEAEEVVGIVSERDIVRAVAAGGLEKPISTCMTADVLFADPGETVDSLLSRMTDRRIRHIPVVHEGRLHGIVSIGDVVKQRLDELQTERDSLVGYLQS